MHPATEWAWWIAHLCGSVKLSGFMFSESGVVVSCPVEASLRALKLIEWAYRDDTVTAVTRERVDLVELDQTPRNLRSGEGSDLYDAFLADVIH